MSTSFQPAEWDYQFFLNVPSAITPLANLNPQHIRLQGISQGVPQTTPSSWDFTVLDAVTQPVLGVGDHSPEFQVAKAPNFMYTNNGASSFNDSFLDTSYGQFAAYAADVVRYYNTGGFTSSDNVFHTSPAYPNDKITWWGIYNEPSINNFTIHTSTNPALDYTTMYNVVVPAMKAADPSGNQKFVALEMCCGSEDWVPIFASDVTQQVDAVATHYYSSCNQGDTDAQMMATVPGFASSVRTIYSNLQNSGNLLVMSAPVWITENNVNADFSDSTGHSVCIPSHPPFVSDHRGSSAFFAAWRPYVFSQAGKAGTRLLHHWAFDADAQYGEVNWPGNNTFQLQLSYWVDYWLQRYFPSGTSQKLLDSTNSNNAQVEVLPVANPDGSVVIMVSNHAVASATDNNGKGLTADVSIDTSALGGFASASKLVMDSTTSATTGPAATSISPVSPISLTMNGYSVVFITLQ